MAEVVARDKYHCPACGADAHWNPAKQALVCPYCGTVSPAKLTASGEIQENDLVTALRNAPSEERGWKTERISVKCQSCQAISVLEPSRVGQRCEFCGSAQLVPYEQIRPPITPGSLLAFKISEAAIRDAIRRWYGTRWFAPNALKSRAATDRVRGVYLPYWTFDAQAHSEWTAESGYHYYTTESYTDANGRTQTRQVQHTRWQPSAGEVDHFFDDELVAASRGVEENLLTKIEPFPTKELVPYDPGYLAGWIVEQYQVDLTVAVRKSHSQMQSEMQSLCAGQVPGDTYRNLNVETQLTGETFKHVLFPIWLLTFDYGSKSYQVIANGYTGEIAGKHPLSAIKIILFTIAMIVVGLIILMITQR
jgi:DNA-directed RNA polymerase subunit RPC12/RpoP